MPSSSELATRRQLRLLELAYDLEGEIFSGHYASRIMAQLSLPYKDPQNAPEWVRRNNALTLTLTPGNVTAQDGTRQRLYPYGVIPRYLMTWMTTEVVRTRSRQLYLGDSLTQFLASLGMNGSGASGRRVLDQLHRLAVASINIEDVRDQKTRWSITGENFNIASSYDLWFSAKNTPNQDQLLGSTITLSEQFYDEAIKSPVKLHPKILRELGGSAMRLDLYVWLSYRLRNLKNPTTVTWSQLEAQFGAEYKHQRQFKAKFLAHLREVLIFFPHNAVAAQPQGIRLNRAAKVLTQIA
ncbi:replication protein RepA [Glutamicibacter arilaitensis]|uniref:replication protein RepA n=1 Tax=Glutamicibacter arilaitensis TaxID=256701 RepID=UPI003FD134FC